MKSLVTAILSLVIPITAFAEQQQSPTISSTCHISEAALVEYSWTISATTGGDSVLSVVELVRRSGEQPSTRGYQTVLWSKAASKQEKQIGLKVGRSVEGGQRAIWFSGDLLASRNDDILIPESASVSVATRQISREDDSGHVVAITVSKNGAELNRHIIFISVSSTADHPDLVAAVRKHQDKGVPQLTHRRFIKTPEREFRRYSALDK